MLNGIPIQAAFERANPVEEEGVLFRVELRHLDQLDFLGIRDDFGKSGGQIHKGPGRVGQKKAGQCQRQQPLVENRMDGTHN